MGIEFFKMNHDHKMTGSLPAVEDLYGSTYSAPQ